jgi:hypothetical protein
MSGIDSGSEDLRRKCPELAPVLKIYAVNASPFIPLYGSAPKKE